MAAALGFESSACLRYQMRQQGPPASVRRQQHLRAASSPIQRSQDLLENLDNSHHSPNTEIPYSRWAKSTVLSPALVSAYPGILRGMQRMRRSANECPQARSSRRPPRYGLSYRASIIHNLGPWRLTPRVPASRSSPKRSPRSPRAAPTSASCTRGASSTSLLPVASGR
jgi:hypothetical protein